MTTRYKLLPNFPSSLIDIVRNTFYENFPSIESLEKIALSDHEGSILRYTKVDIDLKDDRFLNKMLCMISFPNCGRGQIHIDQGRDFSINIPIQVDYEKGPFVVIKENLYGTIVEPDHINYDYIPEYYEDVKIDCPILVNTAIPHAFVNNSNEWRIMVSIFPRVENIGSAEELVKSWF